MVMMKPGDRLEGRAAPASTPSTFLHAFSPAGQSALCGGVLARVQYAGGCWSECMMGRGAGQVKHRYACMDL